MYGNELWPRGSTSSYSSHPACSVLSPACVATKKAPLAAKLGGLSCRNRRVSAIYVSPA
jgi:hypothetical protein